MFFVVNKEKVYAYVVSILTIVILFFMSTVMKSDFNTEEVSTNAAENVNITSSSTENETNNTNSSLGAAALVSNDNMSMENNTSQ